MSSKIKDVLGGMTSGPSASFLKSEARTIKANANDEFDGTFGTSRVGRAAQTGTVMTIVTLGILGIIGVLVYAQVSESLPDPENEELSSVSGDIDGGFADALGLLPVVLIIMMAALVIAVVQRFRG